MNLTVANVANHYKNGKGTCVFFKELHKDGDFKGKPITFWSSNPDFVPQDAEGWTYDTENDRVNPPVVTLRSLSENKIRFAHSLGMDIRL